MNKRVGSFLFCMCLCLSLCGCAAAVLSEMAKPDDPKVSAEPEVSQEEDQGKDSYAVGEAAELDGVTVTLTQVEESTGGQYMEPEEGKVYLLCHFDIANNGDKDLAVSSIMSFDAYVDDYAASISIGATTSSGADQLDGTVAAGKKMAGVIGYEVDANWSELEIAFTPDPLGRDSLTFVARH